MLYKENLESTKEYYPFDRWRALFFPDPEDAESEGMQQYTQENCDSVRLIFDNLIDGLIAIGESAASEEKIALFKTAVEALNMINEDVEDLIETGEREDLCELIDQITVAAKLNPADYGDGEGLADEWRNW
jgi:hypothetical protein